jgi:hypothetical protein
MIVNEWSPRFKKQYGGEFPSSYLCFDTEFTGNSQEKDLVLEIGHVIVEANKVVDHKSFVLNWYKADIDTGWLDYKLSNMRGIIGAGWRLNPSFIKENGQDPIEVLRFYQQLFDAWKKRELPFVAQNGVWADERMVRSNFNRFLNRSFDLPASSYFDTGVLFKASRIMDPGSPFGVYKGIVLPAAGETLKDYFIRIAGVKIAGLKWNMAAILDFYKLTEKHAIDANQLHGAAYDAMCVHYIMQQYRLLVNEQPKPLSPEGLEPLIEKEIKQIQLEALTAKVENLPRVPTIDRATRTVPAVSPAQRRKQRPV